MGKIIAIANHKGGAAKTTSVVNIGASLAAREKKTLLIDCDAQGNLSEHLGQSEPEHTIYHAFQGKMPLPIIQVSEYLSLVPADLDLVSAEVELMAKPVGREIILRELIEPIKGNYDYILLDCPPNLGQLTINALVAADEVIIPMQAERFPEKGLDKLTDVMILLQKALNPTLTLKGIFFTFFNPTYKLHQALQKRVTARFPGVVFDSYVRRNIQLPEAIELKTDIFNYAPDSSGAEDYKKLTNELLERTLAQA